MAKPSARARTSSEAKPSPGPAPGDGHRRVVPPVLMSSQRRSDPAREGRSRGTTKGQYMRRLILSIDTAFFVLLALWCLITILQIDAVIAT